MLGGLGLQGFLGCVPHTAGFLFWSGLPAEGLGNIGFKGLGFQSFRFGSLGFRV